MCRPTSTSSVLGIARVQARAGTEGADQTPACLQCCSLGSYQPCRNRLFRSECGDFTSGSVILSSKTAKSGPVSFETRDPSTGTQTCPECCGNHARPIASMSSELIVSLSHTANLTHNTSSQQPSTLVSTCPSKALKFKHRSATAAMSAASWAVCGQW
jgi:hypothetical protein